MTLWKSVLWGDLVVGPVRSGLSTTAGSKPRREILASRGRDVSRDLARDAGRGSCEIARPLRNWRNTEQAKL